MWLGFLQKPLGTCGLKIERKLEARVISICETSKMTFKPSVLQYGFRKTKVPQTSFPIWLLPNPISHPLKASLLVQTQRIIDKHSNAKTKALENHYQQPLF